MGLKNTSQKYGILLKIFHWFVALSFIAQYYFVYWKRYMLPEKSPLAGVYIREFHKPLGVVLLGIGLLWVIWRVLNTHPKYPKSMPWYEVTAAKFVHLFLYVCVIIMPLSGLMMSMYSGYPVEMFGIGKIMPFVAQNKELGKFIYSVHESTAYIVMALFVVHVGAALKHHFIDKDGILSRMSPFGRG